jgi:hypothetical protein
VAPVHSIPTLVKKLDKLHKPPISQSFIRSVADKSKIYESHPDVNTKHTLYRGILERPFQLSDEFGHNELVAYGTDEPESMDGCPA